MDVKASRRFTDNQERSTFFLQSGGAGSRGRPSTSYICRYYIVGRCNRNPCRFLHAVSPSSQVNPSISKLLPENRPRKSSLYNAPKNTWVSENTSIQDGSRKTPKHNGPKNSLASSTRNDGLGDRSSAQKTQKICDYWVSGNCVKGDNCLYLHSWSCGDGFTMLAKLDGHKKAVSGIVLPLGSDKLYSGSKDGAVRLWDCHTGQSANLINLGAEVGSLISEGPWVFVGMPNAVKAWNIESSAEFSLEGPVGQVHCMVVANEMLFAGAQDGVILAWKGSNETTCPFQLAASLKGHTRAVICLAVGANRLYSGSMDNTIKVLDLDTLEWVMSLNGHTDTVTSLLCWDQFLLSSCLDRTIKIWVATESGNLEVVYTQKEEHGVLALAGMNDADGKAVLMCACKDNSVHVYDLPSLAERGRIFSKREVGSIQIGPNGLFFTGDGSGMVRVWKLLANPSEIGIMKNP